MSKVLITESYLEDIADSIRAKNGTDTTYKPSEMAGAIDAISGGSANLEEKTVSPSETPIVVRPSTGYDGMSRVNVNAVSDEYVGSMVPRITSLTINDGEVTAPAGYYPNAISGSVVSGTKQISITQNGTTTENVKNYANAEITVNVSGGGGMSVSDFADFLAGNLVDLDFSGVTKLRDYAFRNSKISNGYFPDLTSIGQYVFYNAQITTGAIVLPSLALLPNHALRTTGATLTAFDTTASTINANSLNGCSALTKVVLRSPTVATLVSTTAFDSTPFKDGGTGGTIYVPNALKSSYQTASNWATLNGYGTVTWKSIEGSAYENAYVDGTAISS